MADIKSYKPAASSIGGGQVLNEPYPFDKARTVIWDMADQLALELVAHGLVTNQLTLTVGYDKENLRDQKRRQQYPPTATAGRSPSTPTAPSTWRSTPPPPNGSLRRFWNCSTGS